MKKFALITSAAIFSLSQAGFSYAADAGPQSSATMGVTVIIPPLGEAVQAQKQGATGLWSLVNGKRGLMINAPIQAPGAKSAEISLFAQNANALDVYTSYGFAQTQLKSSGKGQNGLKEISFDLSLEDAQSIPGQRFKTFTVASK